MEKKKNTISITQEQINTIVDDSCVLFCKHCGCGIPRETCISLGTYNDHDEYRTTIRTHLLEKKREYPKTYEECCEVLGCIAGYVWGGYKGDLFKTFHMLYFCREAYWKLYGEEIGLDKPWEPDWTTFEGMPAIFRFRYNIVCDSIKNKHCLLVFPTEEMRDAFYENFKEEIGKCKELL